MSLVLFAVIMIAGIATPYIYEHWRGQTWQELAKKHKLRWFDSGKGTINGSFNGVNVSASAEVHGWGKSRHIRTTIEVSYPGTVPHDLSLSPEGLFAKLGKLVGGQDIQVGDPELDRAFLIKGAFEEEVRPFLLEPRTRTALLAIYRRYPTMCFDRSGVRIELRAFWSAEKVEEAFELITGHMKHMAEGARMLPADAPTKRPPPPHEIPVPW
jgi:hypothetical protein